MNFLTYEQFLRMWQQQDELNSLIDPAWKTKGYDWSLYIKAEVMEFFEYIGYKHWKEPDVTKAATDMQARLELVDIWHFILSRLLEGWNTPQELYSSIKTIVEDTQSTYPENLRAQFKSLDEDQTTYQLIRRFQCAIKFCDWSWQAILETYTQKYVLNKFRQDHGYKDGSYQKEWVGSCSDYGNQDGTPVEDNKVLEYVVHEVGSDGDDVLSEHLLYSRLKHFYATRLNK